MQDKSTTRGGAGRGQGRKPLKSGESTTPVTIRLAESQKVKLAVLGGSRWVRERIDEAAPPKVASD